jgi:hypothetical protein
MDLLDRYLHAVRFWLPRAQQDDIVAEMGDDIRSQAEDQETKLGRKLNESELEAILKQRGRPLLVASRYLPQQYLIGPLLFPAYRFVLTIIALCYLGAVIARVIGLMSFDSSYRAAHSVVRAFAEAWGPLWLAIFTAVGIVTIIFVALERVQARTRFLEDWSPRKLPAVRDPNQIGRINSLLDLAANGIFIAWWVMDMWSTTIFDHAGVRITLAPAWKYFLWVFLLIAVANIILAGVNLARPYWTWPRASLQLASTVAASAGFCWICKASLLAQIVAPNLSSTRAAEIVNAINLNLSRAFPFVLMACVLIVALSGVGRLIRLRSGRTRLMPGVAV